MAGKKTVSHPWAMISGAPLGGLFFTDSEVDERSFFLRSLWQILIIRYGSVYFRWCYMMRKMSFRPFMGTRWFL